MKIAFYLFTFLFISCQSIRSVDVEEELNLVLEGRKKTSELGFRYYDVIYLDTGFYSIISQFEGFDPIIESRDGLSDLVNYSYDDTVTLDHEYFTIIDVVNKSKKFKTFINPEKHKIHGPLAVSGNKALLDIDNSTYLLELMDSSSIGISEVVTVFADGFPKSLIKKWERIKRREEKKQKKQEDKTSGSS